MKNEKSCGTITLCGNKVLLIRQKKSGNYGFPKGHIEAGETEIETAIRETKEETNVDVEVIPNLRYSLSYIQKETINKEVVYYVAKSKANAKAINQESEIETVFWVNKEDVINTLSFDNMKEIWKKAYNDIKKLN